MLLGRHKDRSGSASDAQDNEGGQQTSDTAGHKGKQVITGLTAYRARAKGRQSSTDLMESKNPRDDDRRILAAEHFIRQCKSCRTSGYPIEAIEDRKKRQTHNIELAEWNRNQ